jgi:hypothetical protein
MIAAAPTIPSVTEQITTHFHIYTETLPICDKYYILYWQARYRRANRDRTPCGLRLSAGLGSTRPM